MQIWVYSLRAKGPQSLFIFLGDVPSNLRNDMGVSRNGDTPSSLDGFFHGKSHERRDDLGAPPFQEMPISNFHPYPHRKTHGFPRKWSIFHDCLTVVYRDFIP